MAQPEVGVVGLRKFIKQLEALGVDVTDLKAAWQRVGNIVVQEAKGNVHSISGALAGSIRPSMAKGGSTIRAGSAKVPYAGVIHFGWPRRNIEANQYLYDASAAKQQEVVTAISDELNNLVRKLGLN